MSAVRAGSGRNKWYRLDNAAKIYPAIKKANWSSVFRMSVRLFDKIDPAPLQTALGHTLDRFPGFKVQMRRGLFWYYLENNPHPPPEVQEDIINPCLRVRWRENNGYLLKVYYYGCRISVEFFHALTDGFGGVTFLKTLTAEYLRLKGFSIENTHGVLDIHEKPDPEELEDAYGRYADSNIRRRWKEDKAYHYGGTPEAKHSLNIITGIMPADKALAAAKYRKVSLTELFTAVMTETMLQLQAEENPMRYLPVKISVPVNVRRFYPSKTLRNFSLYLNPGIDPNMGDYSFEEILHQTHHYMKFYLNKKQMNAIMTVNVVTERNPFLRPVPLFLKNIAMAAVFNQVGEALFSSTITNLGPVEVPEGMRDLVERFEFTLGSAMSKFPNCAMLSFGNQLVINISSAIRETEVEKRFFRRLVQMGIPVKIESNRV